ncbi:MAG: M24 family metallopeptidase [Proteobacteria bacterium]|nr:M24 family metallopeptidase [Pseudomonadota bacterium]
MMMLFFMTIASDYFLRSSDDKLHFGVILCSLGVRYKFYCSNIVRTFMVEPTQAQQDLYNYLLSLLDLVLNKLKAGKNFARRFLTRCSCKRL